MNVLVSDISDNRESWLSAREGKISSSTIATIAGLNKYKSAFELWCEFTGKKDNEFSGNDYTRLGQVLEPFIAELFWDRNCSDDNGLTTANTLYQHKEIEWAIASPDYMYWERDGKSTKDVGIVECKTANGRLKPHWSDIDCPKSYKVQLQWQLGVVGLGYGWVAGLVGGDPNDFFHPKFDFNESMFSQLLDIGHKFITCVERDIPPNPGPGDSKLIEEVMQRDYGKQLELEDDMEWKISGIVDELEALKDKKSRADKESRELDKHKKALENKLKVLFKDAAYCELSDDRQIRIKKTEVKAQVRDAYEYTRIYIKGA